MDTRALGRTGQHSTLMVFGAAAFWEAEQDEVNATMQKVLDLGVNHIDVAPAYGVAEERLGQWLPPHRDKFFVGCKTFRRAPDEVWADINASLEKLGIDAFDLYQAHRIRTVEDVDILFDEGTIQAMQRARDEGLTRFLGITGHGLGAPAAYLAALERFDFDTIMFPLNPNLYAKPDYRRDAERLLALASERGVGVLIIKSVAKTLWGDRAKTYQPWYEPFDTPEKITEGVHFALSQPGVTAVVSTGDMGLMPLVAEAAENFTPMSAERQAEAIAAWEPLTSLFPGPMG